MARPPRVLALRQLRCPFFCLIATFLLIIGVCHAAEVTLATEDAGSQDPGSQDHVVHRIHPKAPPLPREEDIPPNSSLYNLKLKQGDWYVDISNDAPDSEVRDLIRRICEEAGEPHSTSVSIYAMWLSRKHGYERTNAWFENSGASTVFDWFLADLVMSAADRPVNVLEIGSFEGGSAVWIAENLLQHPDSMLICIDLWTTGGPDLEDQHHVDSAGSEDRFRSNMANAPNNERVTAIKGDSLLSLSGLIAAGGTSTFDAIYVDGSHTMKDALADALLSFRLLKVGGLLIFDDMKSFSGVERATAAVIEALGKDCVEVLHSESQMVARKTAEDPWITPESVVTMGTDSPPLLSTFAAQPTRTYPA